MSFCLFLCAVKQFVIFFFLMIRRPPRSTLFPTRRSSDLHPGDRDELDPLMLAMVTLDVEHERSEEHTSELQSPDHLVCRLLLEKKKLRKDLPYYHAPTTPLPVHLPHHLAHRAVYHFFVPL